MVGHEGCGAVTAALQAQGSLENEPNEIRALVRKIEPAVKTIDEHLPFKDRLHRSVEANVRAAVKQLQAVEDLAVAQKKGKTKIIGCVYDIDSGTVKVLAD